MAPRPLGLQLAERYADRPMDLADAALAVAAMTSGVAAAWTLDRAACATYRLPSRKRFRLVEMRR